MRLRNHVQGVEVWAGADAALVDMFSMLARSNQHARNILYSVLAEPGEDSRLRLERCTKAPGDDDSASYYDDGFDVLSDYQKTGDALIFTDSYYPRRHSYYARRLPRLFRVQPTAAETDSLLKMATAPWSELVHLYDAGWPEGYRDQDHMRSAYSPVSMPALKPQSERNADQVVYTADDDDPSGGGGDPDAIAHPMDPKGGAPAGLDKPSQMVSEPYPERVQAIEEWRRLWLRAERLRPKFLSSGDRSFQDLRTVRHLACTQRGHLLAAATHPILCAASSRGHN